MRRNTIGLTVAAVAAAGVVGVAGAAIASAADDTTPTSTSSPSSPTDSLPGGGEGSTDQQMPDGKGGPGGSQDEAVTGDEAQDVIDAVEAKDTSVTIDTVRKDPDGSYDALGTKDGQPVMYDVSADLKTITEHTGGPGGHGGPGGSQDEAVTGDEAQDVIDAVEAQDTSVTIDSVRKDPDGSYDALGTKDGQPVMYDVSTDLKTITEHTGGPGGPGGHGGPGGSDAEGGSTSSSDPTDANTASSV